MLGKSNTKYSPKGGLTVIYHGTICKKSPTKQIPPKKKHKIFTLNITVFQPSGAKFLFPEKIYALIQGFSGTSLVKHHFLGGWWGRWEIDPEAGWVIPHHLVDPRIPKTAPGCYGAATRSSASAEHGAETNGEMAPLNLRPY